MKYIQFGIMAVLLLGLAASPAFSNGFAFADRDEAESDDGPPTDGPASSTRDQEQVSSQKEQESDKTEPRDTPTECTRGVDGTEDPESTKDCPNRNSSSN